MMLDDARASSISFLDHRCFHRHTLHKTRGFCLLPITFSTKIGLPAPYHPFTRTQFPFWSRTFSLLVHSGERSIRLHSVR